MKYTILLAILVQMLYGQDMDNYNPEVVSEWSNGKSFNDLNEICIEDCNRTCITKCPVADLCDEDEIQCGKADLPVGVWHDCTRDDICVPDDCECNIIFFTFIYAKDSICL